MGNVDVSNINLEVVKYLNENNIKLIMKVSENGLEVYTKKRK